MSEDERVAVTDVVREKEGDRSDGRQERQIATLEEGEVDRDHDNNEPEEDEEVDPLAQVSVNIKTERVSRSFKCSYCPKFFTLSDNLEEHISRRHPGKKSKKSKKKLKGLKEERLVQRRRSVPAQRRTDIPEGEGFPCKECGKPFKTESMAEFHYTDVHVQGHFPCKGGCGKIFTSKNKMSSHWSRHCNDKSKKRNSL